jgi:hypothetical protein
VPTASASPDGRCLFGGTVDRVHIEQGLYADRFEPRDLKIIADLINVQHRARPGCCKGLREETAKTRGLPSFRT